MFRKIALAALVCAASTPAFAKEIWVSAYRPDNGQSYVDFLKAHSSCGLEWSRTPKSNDIMQHLYFWTGCMATRGFTRIGNRYDGRIMNTDGYRAATPLDYSYDNYP
jgi:hypothetical protein